jgi:hypothetical protein
MTTIFATDFGQLTARCIDRGPSADRDKDAFLVEAADQSVGICGSYDDLLEFAAALMAAVYSWPLLHGHSDWLNDQPNLTKESETGDGRRQDNTAGSGDQDGGRQEGSGTSVAGPHDRIGTGHVSSVTGSD